jgi:pimeloyl-ACP methyl ester carboxylesterase
MQQKSSRRKWLRGAALVSGLVVGAYAGGCFLAAKAYLNPVRLPEGPRPAFLADGNIPATGYEIPAWVSPRLTVSDGPRLKRPVVILTHGFGGSRSDWVELAEQLAPSADVIVLATHGQTVSPVKGVGFGTKESDEVIAAAEWAKTKSDGPVIAVGTSMGGAASWLASEKRPELFDAIVTEAAFARLDWASDDFLSVGIKPGAFLFRPVNAMARQMSGIDPNEVRPIRAARAWRGRPALIVHGAEDVMFGARHAEALRDASGAPLWWVPGAGHSEVSRMAAPEFASRILQLVRAPSPTGAK